MAEFVTYPLSSDSLLQGLGELRDETSLCDVWLVAEGVKFPAHRVVLAAASPYFRAMFSKRFREDKMKSIQIKEVSEEGLRRVLDAIYNSEVKVSEENIARVTAAANLLRMDEIVKRCETFMYENIAGENVFAFLKVAENFELKQAVDTCNEYILDEFDSVAKTRGFCELSKEKMCHIISDDSLKLPHGEIEVFRAAVRWIENNSEKIPAAEKPTVVTEVMKLVRFPHIGFDSLVEEVLHHPILDGIEECKCLLRKALRFHGRPAEQALCEGPQYKSRGEQKIAMIQNGTRDKGYAVEERESLIQFFSLSNDTLLADAETQICPRSFMFSSVSVLARDSCFFVFAADSESFKPVAFVFNSMTEKWTDLKPPSGPAAVGARVVMRKDKFYLTGGMHVTKDSPFLLVPECVKSTMQEYTMGLGSWRELSEMPQGLVYHTAVSYGDIIYVAGGYNSNGVTVGKMYAYDPSGDIWLTKADMKYPRCNHCLECVDENIYACGGRIINNAAPRTIIEMYSICSDQWTVLENAAVPGYGCASVVLNNKIYLVGGYKLDEDNKWVRTDSVTCIDAATKTVVKGTKLPFRYSYPACAVLTVPRR